ncbi:TolC family protein [Deinococcus psychrotolerans]|uniref:TolC family protein n=1 Tax=Deinococcus psychrotolerans TaxID=2489213 RepID=UPI0013DDF33A|nr:TolC family protein [Deinococcus psychrotolerans]
MNALPRTSPLVRSRTANPNAALLCASLLGSALFGSALAQTAPLAAPPVTATPAAAPAPPAALVNPVLSFDQVQQAIKTSPGWRSAEENYRAAQYNLDAARARTGLSLSVGASAMAGKTPLDGGDYKAAATLTGQVGAAVLPWGSAFDPLHAAERALSRAALDLQESRQTLLLTALQNYLAAQSAAAQETLTAAQAALAAKQLDAAQVQRQNNLLSLEGLLDRQGNLENAQASAIAAQANREITQRQLLSDLGLDVGLNLKLVLPSLAALPDAPAPVEDLLAQALQGRSEIQKAASQLEDARAAVVSAQRDRLPGLSANVNYGELGGTGGRSVSGSLDFKTGVTGAQISFPLKGSETPLPTSLSLGLNGSFNVLGSAASAAIASAQSSQRSAELALQSARTSVELDVRRKDNDALSTRRLVEVQQTALTRAQTALASARARLDAGLGTALDVQVADVAVQNAQTNVDQAVSNAYLAKLQLDKAAARLNAALILTAGAKP